MTVTFLGRSQSRWRVRVDLAEVEDASALTIGLVDESGRELGPAMVAPAPVERCCLVELNGPADLPPGTVVRCVADRSAGPPLQEEVGVDARRGLHAYLNADARLPLISRAEFQAVEGEDYERLVSVLPWLRAGCCGG